MENDVSARAFDTIACKSGQFGFFQKRIFFINALIQSVCLSILLYTNVCMPKLDQSKMADGLLPLPPQNNLNNITNNNTITNSSSMLDNSNTTTSNIRIYNNITSNQFIPQTTNLSSSLSPKNVKTPPSSTQPLTSYNLLQKSVTTDRDFKISHDDNDNNKNNNDNNLDLFTYAPITMIQTTDSNYQNKDDISRRHSKRNAIQKDNSLNIETKMTPERLADIEDKDNYRFHHINYEAQTQTAPIDFDYDDSLRRPEENYKHTTIKDTSNALQGNHNIDDNWNHNTDITRPVLNGKRRRSAVEEENSSFQPNAKRTIKLPRHYINKDNKSNDNNNSNSRLEGHSMDEPNNPSASLLFKSAHSNSSQQSSNDIEEDIDYSNNNNNNKKNNNKNDNNDYSNNNSNNNDNNYNNNKEDNGTISTVLFSNKQHRHKPSDVTTNVQNGQFTPHNPNHQMQQELIETTENSHPQFDLVTHSKAISYDITTMKNDTKVDKLLLSESQSNKNANDMAPVTMDTDADFDSGTTEVPKGEFQINRTGILVNTTLAPSSGGSVGDGHVHPLMDQRIIRDQLLSSFDLEDLLQLASTLQGVGVLLGALIGGLMADVFGRRRPLYLSLLGMAASQCALVLCISWSVFLVLRTFAVGFAGSTLVISFVMVIEFVGPSWRDACTCSCLWTLGAVGLSLETMATTNWRWLALSTGGLALPLLGAFYTTPESLRWLQCHHKFPAAEGVYREVVSVNSAAVPEMMSLLDQARVCIVNNMHRKRYTFLDLFYNLTSVRSTFALVYTGMVSSCVYACLSSIVRQLTGNIYADSCLPFLIDMPLTWSTIIVNRCLGRRWCLFLYSVASGLALMSVTILHMTGNVSSMPSLVTGIALFGKIGVTASISLIFLVAIEMYPTVSRGMGVGVALASGAGGVVLSQVLFFLRDYHYIVPFVVYGFLMTSVGLVGLLLPETLNMPLINVQQCRHRKIPLVEGGRQAGGPPFP